MNGVFLTIISALSLSIMGFFIKLLDDIPSSFSLFARFLVSFIIIIPFVINDKNFSFKVYRLNGIFLRSIFGFVAMMIFFFSLTTVPTSQALLMINSAPIFVPIILFLFFKIPSNIKVVTGIIISFIGITLILDVTHISFTLNSLVGWFSGLFAAFAMILLRVIGKKNSPNQMMFYYFLFITVFALIYSLFDYKYFSSLNLHHLFLLLCAGIFGSIYQFGLTYALKITEIHIVTSLMLLSVVFSWLINWAIYLYIPKINYIIGSLIVILGIILVLFYSRKQKVS